MNLVSKNLPFVQSKYLINSFCNLGPFRKGAYGQRWNLLVFFYCLYARQLCNIVQARSRSWVSQSKMNISGKSMMLSCSPLEACLTLIWGTPEGPLALDKGWSWPTQHELLEISFPRPLSRIITKIRNKMFVNFFRLQKCPQQPPQRKLATLHLC